MKNFLLFTLEYPPFFGGIANYYSNLVKFWPEKNIFILNNNGGKLINEKLKIKWWPSLKALFREVKKNNINYVLVGQILPLGTVAYLLSFVLPFKYGVFLHGLDFSLAIKNEKKSKLTKKILDRADKIICANSKTLEMVKDFIKTEEKIFLINPGIEIRDIKIEEDITIKLKNNYDLENKFIAITVCRLVKRKGIDMVLSAIKSVINNFPDIFYVIVGNGEEEVNLRNIINQLHLEKNVMIINNAKDEERNAWYSLADVFIMTPRDIDGDFEGFGIVYLEANLFSKPVIAGDSGGIKDAVVNNINGLLVNPLNEKDIATAISTLYKDTNLRLSLGEKGRKRLIEFSWDKKINEIYKIINL